MFQSFVMKLNTGIHVEEDIGQEIQESEKIRARGGKRTRNVDFSYDL